MGRVSRRLLWHVAGHLLIFQFVPAEALHLGFRHVHGTGLLPFHAVFQSLLIRHAGAGHGIVRERMPRKEESSQCQGMDEWIQELLPY
jgi:hypothetical protein